MRNLKASNFKFTEGVLLFILVSSFQELENHIKLQIQWQYVCLISLVSYFHSLVPPPASSWKQDWGFSSFIWAFLERFPSSKQRLDQHFLCAFFDRPKLNSENTKLKLGKRSKNAQSERCLTREIKQYFIAIEYIVRLNISNLTVHNRNLFKINFLKMCYEAGLS